MHKYTITWEHGAERTVMPMLVKAQTGKEAINEFLKFLPANLSFPLQLAGGKLRATRIEE